MPRGSSTTPRSPLRMAVLTFGGIVLLGTMATLLVFGKASVVSDAPTAYARWVGRATGLVGVAGAAIAYLVQRRRLQRLAAAGRAADPAPR